MVISHIVAVSRNFVIGNKNKLPWKMPDDAKYFHDVTMGHVVIMGRKNYEANKKALPGRTNVVVTRSENFAPEDAKVVDSMERALQIAAATGESEVFIVGGGEIYKQTLDMADRIYITMIDAEYSGDTYYPEIDFSSYKVVSEKSFPADEKNPHSWTYFILEKKG